MNHLIPNSRDITVEVQAREIANLRHVLQLLLASEFDGTGPYDRYRLVEFALAGLAPPPYPRGGQRCSFTQEIYAQGVQAQ